MLDLHSLFYFPSIVSFFPSEWKNKYDVEDDDAEDTVSYNMRNTYFFRPDLSYPLTGEEILTVPHMIVMFGTTFIKREREAMLDLVVEGMGVLFDGKAFMQIAALDLFFRGFIVDCSKEEFSAKAICSAFYTGDIKQAVQVNETCFLVSLFGAVIDVL